MKKKKKSKGGLKMSYKLDDLTGGGMMSESDFGIPKAKWLKGEVVEEKGIKSVTIVEIPRPKMSDEWGWKLEATVDYEGKKATDPYIVSFNKTSGKLLEKQFTKLSNMVGKQIPIKTMKTKMGVAIYIDEEKMVANSMREN
jgi:hypothetical protein